ncbi:MAG TPA: iron ABC transporter permease, partial [Dehalococcoidia bacterium]|nr:iron ABC transporter permease [Dehalococcoidia bacterium]
MTARSGSEAAAATTAATLAAPPTAKRLQAPLLPSVLLLTAALLLTAGMAVSLGPVHVPFLTVWRVLLHRLFGLDTGALSGGTDAIVWQIRLPRVVLAGMVGATLACSGATYQGVFRNPLAEPYLIGVASGAGLGAAVAIVTPLHASWHGLGTTPLFAFAGAMAAVSIAYGVARSGGATPAATLILAGVAVSTLASSAMSFIFLQHNERFLTILSWLLGGFNTASWSACALVLPYVLLMLATVLGFGRVLNVLQFGEEQAQQLGLPVERVKLLLLIAASLGAAAAV